MEPRITIITLGVTDFMKSYEFYKIGLGFPTDGIIGDDIAFFKLKGMLMSIYPKHKLAEDAGVPDNGSGFAGFTLAHNVGSKEAVDAVIELAKKAGATITDHPHDRFWGGYSGYFSDPDGYLWEVAWNPFISFD